MKNKNKTFANIPLQSFVRESIERTQLEIWKTGALGELSTVAKTPRQRRLQAKHGTPREFASVCVEALGEISISECIKSVRDYQQKWEES